MMQGFLISLFSFGLSAAAPSASDIEFIEQTLAKAHVEGAAIAIVEDGHIVFENGFGALSVETGENARADSRFQVASLGKIPVAYAAIILHENGTLNLDAPISGMDSSQSGCPAPSLRDALAHTAGLTNDFRADAFSVDCTKIGKFQYSGQGYMAISEAISVAAGMSPAEAIQELVFAPLEMNQTEYGSRSGQGIANGHVSNLSSMVMNFLSARALWLSGIYLLAGLASSIALLVFLTRMIHITAALAFIVICTITLYFAAGQLQKGNSPAQTHFGPDETPASLVSNAHDLALLSIELLDPELVSEAARDSMFSEAVNVDGCVSWSLGLGVDNCGERKTYWQWGSNLGFESLFVIEP